MEGPPEKRRTIQENGLWHGRSPGKRQNLPGKWLLAWKVPLKNAGPSLKTAPDMEGPPEKRRTFRENGSWHGRSPGKTKDLPGKWPPAWKVPLKTPDSPPEKGRTFQENGLWHGRSRCRCRVSSEKGRFFGTKRRKGGVCAEIGPSTKRAVLVDGEDRMAGKKKKRPRRVASYRVAIRSIRRCSGHRPELSSGKSSPRRRTWRSRRHAGTGGSRSWRPPSPGCSRR